MKKVLFLYTETAPYFMASVERLVSTISPRHSSSPIVKISARIEKTVSSRG